MLARSSSPMQRLLAVVNNVRGHHHSHRLHQQLVAVGGPQSPQVSALPKPARDLARGGWLAKSRKFGRRHDECRPGASAGRCTNCKRSGWRWRQSPSPVARRDKSASRDRDTEELTSVFFAIIWRAIDGLRPRLAHRSRTLLGGSPSSSAAAQSMASGRRDHKDSPSLPSARGCGSFSAPATRRGSI
jgi:hypothetical protein